MPHFNIKSISWVLPILLSACTGGEANEAEPDGARDDTTDHERALDLGGNVVVFVSDTRTIPAQMGGVAGADQICQAEADAAGLNGTFLAWLSTSTIDATQRLPATVGTYVRPDGQSIASSTADFVDGSVLQVLDVNAAGVAVSRAGIDKYVWTGTTDDGATSGATCDDWAAGSSALGSVGQIDALTGWSDSGLVGGCGVHPLRLFCVGALDAQPGPTSGDQQNFSIVVLPDSQSLVLNDTDAAVFTSQTQWIVDNQGSEQRNIAFVLHEGDIVNDNTTEQWDRADASLSLLDGVVPFAFAPGNHDMGPLGKASNRDTTLLNNYFGVSRYSSLPTFGGVFPDEGTMDNSYHLFSAGGVDWLVLALEFGPRDQVLAWADTVAESFADRRIIVVTHAYMYSDDTLHGSSPTHRFNPNGLPINNLPGGVNDGQEMWDNFIRKHHNISFVFSGHIVADGTNDDGTGQLVGVGDNGNLVYQMLANYQRDDAGARNTDGYMRIIEFDRPDPAELWTVSVETYSPFLDLSRSEADESFVFEDVDLEFRPSLNETFDGTMDGWTTEDEGAILSPSNWSVQANQAAQVSNIYGPDAQATDNRQGTFAYWDDPGALLWDDYTCAANMRSTDNDGIGLMFRYQDKGNYYKVEMDNQRGFATLFKMQAGVETTLATDNNHQYAIGSIMRLEVSAVGSEITVLLDGAELFAPVTDADYLPVGTVALYSWGNNGAYFDDVVVQAAETP